jgi:hypothetical protein
LNTTANLQDILATKFSMMGKLGVKKSKGLIATLGKLGSLNRKQLAALYDFELLDGGTFE